MKKVNWERLAPPGFSLEVEVVFFGLAAAIAVLFSFLYLSDLSTAVRSLYDHFDTAQQVLRHDAVMPDFKELLGTHLNGFPLLACSTVLFAAIHYASFYQGSKSIYLMRRLPNRWELHKRCLALPIMGAAAALLLGFLLLLLYFWIYLLRTPAPCLTPHQWAKLWR